jgi:hypothetical protein
MRRDTTFTSAGQNRLFEDALTSLNQAAEERPRNLSVRRKADRVEIPG